MELIDGKEISLKIRGEIKQQTAILAEKGIRPCLAVVLAGEDPASLSYVKAKGKALADIGMEGRDIRLPADVSEAELLAVISDLNDDNNVHGILIQLPLPRHINEYRVLCAVDPAKDVDCFNPVSVGNIILGRPGFLPCTPHGILVLLREMKIPVSGAYAVIVGRSNLVGRPLLNLLSRRDMNATVTMCHSATTDLARHTLKADILIVAAGKPLLIKPEMVKAGAAVIDVGVNRVPDSSKKKGYRLCGDVDPAAAEKAGWYTPVPGGVGPMTITMLLHNVLQAASAEEELQ